VRISPGGALAGALSASWRRLDRSVSDRTALLPAGEILCRPGCFGCCVGLFALPVAEALAARSVWERLSGREREEPLRRARRAVDETGSLFPGDAVVGFLDPGRSEREEDRYFDRVAAVACPFLDLPSGGCLVYRARPVTCRTFGLALRTGPALSEPACLLNFSRTGVAGQLESAVDTGELLSLDQAVAEAAGCEGLPGGAETTLAHVLSGSAFTRPLRRPF
jgi:Fe-S-cluster containining protein